MKEEYIGPSLGKSIGLMFVGGFLVVVALGCVLFPPGLIALIVGVFGAPFFFLGVVVIILRALPKSTYLRFTQDGLTIRRIYRKAFLRWSDIKEIRSIEITNGKTVTYVVLTLAANVDVKRVSPLCIAPLNKYSESPIQNNERLLPENYDMKVPELIFKLNQWKNRYSSFC